ncbi:hypothetical protein A2866_02430 [Candidatus Roizmanbacteria bacterium RIFCSPHIGHO2_01_FULL_39_8]|uniref:DUF1059 domain-containing protein n=1 Tax=Candidatus Roizmanbacteria bacterium RIFCSPHIGHO2_01_FULL_39_8 TaxID=1802033 RepID=A0A1F7GTZ3_9BACT|nr:MAG: hypothetical protein A2866_02430 [Candidatus Roizmanbacteria bacterium RIFCSPHIGHO2_01_FULL_39_8]
MKYSFTCPLAGCGDVMTVQAENKEETLNKLTEKAKNHLKISHPEVSKTDREVRNDAASKLTILEN